MQETTNYKLPLYEMDDMANLNDGYNNAMNVIDAELNKNATDLASRFPIQSADIGAGQVTTANIANGAVTDVKLAADAVTADKLAPNAVIADNLVNDSITTEKIADGAITIEKLAAGFEIGTVQIADGSITTEKLADMSVTSEKLEDGSVTASILANNSVMTKHIQNGAVTNAQLAEDSVTAANIVDGEIGDAQIGDHVIQVDKINPSAFDNSPTIDSDNLLTSGTVYKALEPLTINVGELNTKFGTLDTAYAELSEEVDTIQTQLPLNDFVFPNSRTLNDAPISCSVLSNAAKTIFKVYGGGFSHGLNTLPTTIIPNSNNQLGIKLGNISDMVILPDDNVYYNNMGFMYRVDYEHADQFWIDAVWLCLTPSGDIYCSPTRNAPYPTTYNCIIFQQIPLSTHNSSTPIIPPVNTD